MTKVLVTGATGFLGGHAARRFSAMGWDVTGTGRSEDEGIRLEKEGIRFVQADLRDAEAVGKAVRDQEYVFHCAALSSPWGTYQAFYGSNVEATRNIVESCLKHDAARLIHISTPSLYFDFKPRRMIAESDPLPVKQANFYSATKLLAEDEVLKGWSAGLPALILRPRAIFGPRDSTLFPRLLEVNEGIGLPMLNGGDALIDLTYVDNVVDAMLLGCQAGPEALGRAYNISNGEEHVFRELMEKLFRLLGLSMRPRRIPYRAAYAFAGLLEAAYRVLPLRGEPRLTRYTAGSIAVSHTLDISLARRYLGYEPKVSVEEGLRRFADWRLKEC